MKKKDDSVLLENRKAHYLYFLSDFMIAGLVLTGTEIKSLRRHDASINEAYIFIKNGEAFISNMHIAPYKEGHMFNVDHLRDRKLLLNKREIKKLDKKIQQGGYTCVPTKLFLQNGYAKLEIALAKGKKLHDKRDTIKARDQQREADKAKRLKY